MRILCQRENQEDAHGHTFTPESLKANDGKQVPLTRNFDPREILGVATMRYVEGEGLYAEIDAQGLEGLQVAIGGMVAEYTKTESGQRNMGCEVKEASAVERATDPTLPRIGDRTDG